MAGGAALDEVRDRPVRALDSGVRASRAVRPVLASTTSATVSPLTSGQGSRSFMCCQPNHTRVVMKIIWDR